MARVMSLDCEFNQPSRNLIQIGACVFETTAPKFEVIDSININVLLPEGETVSPFITELTGITDLDLRHGVVAYEAYCQLKEFHQKNKCFMNPVVWGSGVSNDSLAIHNQAQPKEPNFMGYRVVDVKTIHQSISLQQSKKLKGGLRSSLESYGLVWDDTYGLPHRALPDAHNTAILWHHLINKIGRI